MMLIDVPAPPVVDPALDDATIIERLKAIAHTERELRCDFIVYLAAFDERRAYLGAGFPSTFAWLTDHLHYAKATAFRRITGARLYARMPVVAAYLREGRLSLTKLSMLKDILAPENGLELLERAASLSEKEVEELALVLDPRRASAPPRDCIRPLPPAPPRPSVDPPDRFSPALPVNAPQISHPAVGSTPELPPAPLRHQIRMTVGAEFMSLLEEVRAELSHSHPGAPLETILAECMRATLTARRKRSRGDTARPRARAAEPAGRSRTIPAAVKRAVWKRDGNQCTFVADDGRRCTATHRLELHHQQPYGRGGPPTVENIRVMCRRHNDLMARRDYGDALMDRHTKRGGVDAARSPRGSATAARTWLATATLGDSEGDSTSSEGPP